jgi:malate permease and related proteins
VGADCSDDQRLQSAFENRMLPAMAEALLNVIAMFLIMMASYVFMKKSPYPVEVVNNLVFNFFLPVTVFHSIAGLSKLPAGELLLMAAMGFAVTYVMYLFSTCVARVGGIRDCFRKTFVLGAVYGNHVFIGLPVCYAFLGVRGTVLAMFFTIGGYFFLYVVGTYIMTGRVTVGDVFKNPLILAMGAGCLCVVIRIPIPALLSHTFALMSAATFPLAMMVVGGGLQLRFFADREKMSYTVCASLIKLAVVPLVTWGGGLLLGLTRDQLAICVLQSAMPTAVLVTVFSVKYDADPAFSNAIVSLTTLACMVTIPLLFFLLP